MRRLSVRQSVIRMGRLYFDQLGRPHFVWPEWMHRAECAYARIRRALPLGGTPAYTKTDLDLPPFFIVGSGRSGNTLLRRLLTNSSNVHIPPETYVLGRVVKEFRRSSQVGWRTLVRWMIAEFVLHPEFDAFGLSNVNRLLAELDSLSKDRRSLAAILNAFYRYHALQSGVACERWGDKTPINAFCLSRLNSVFPNAQYIHIVRDGFDTVASYISAGLYEQYEHAAARWVASTRQVETFIKREKNGLTIRYEDLVKEPESVCRRVSQFLDIQFEYSPGLTSKDQAAMGDVEKLAHHSGVQMPVFTASVGAGRRSLSPKQLDKIGDIIGPQMRRLGYS